MNEVTLALKKKAMPKIYDKSYRSYIIRDKFTIMYLFYNRLKVKRDNALSHAKKFYNIRL